MRHYPPGRPASVRQRNDDHPTHCTNYLRDIEQLLPWRQITTKPTHAHDSGVVVVLHMSLFHELMKSWQDGQEKKGCFIAASPPESLPWFRGHHDLHERREQRVCHSSIISRASPRYFVSLLPLSGTPHERACVAFAVCFTRSPKHPRLLLRTSSAVSSSFVVRRQRSLWKHVLSLASSALLFKSVVVEGPGSWKDL